MVTKCSTSNLLIHLQVGGEFFETVMFAMNSFGRVSVCGTISTYNVEDPPKGILKIVDIMIYIYYVGKVQILSLVTAV